MEKVDVFSSEENKLRKKNEEFIWRQKIVFFQGNKLTAEQKEENISRSKMFLQRRGKRRIICKRLVYLDDHLQEACPSR